MARLVAMNRQGMITVVDDRGREVGHYQIVYGSTLTVNDGQRIEQGQTLAEWDPFTFSILTENAVRIVFRGLDRRRYHVHEDVDEVTGLSRQVVWTRLMKKLAANRKS